jgi:hypothetical protein
MVKTGSRSPGLAATQVAEEILKETVTENPGDEGTIWESVGS